MARLAPTSTAIFLLASTVAGFAAGTAGGHGGSPAASDPAPVAASASSAPAAPVVAPAIAKLDARRTAARRRLSAATRPGRQAATATELAAAYRAARRSIANAPGRVALGQDLRERLARAELAYRELAKAARGGSATAWQAARDETLDRERDLELLLRLNRWT
jgi:hypothetical protein